MISIYLPLLKDEDIIIRPQEPRSLTESERLAVAQAQVEERINLLRELVRIEAKYNNKKMINLYECESSNIWGCEEEVFFTQEDENIVNEILDRLNDNGQSDDYLLDIFEAPDRYGVRYFMIINILKGRIKLMRAMQRLSLASFGRGIGSINKLPNDLLEEISKYIN